MNNDNIIFRNQSGWGQFIFFVLLFTVGLIAALFISIVTTYLWFGRVGVPIEEYTLNYLRTTQIISTVFMFLIPACAYAHLSTGNIVAFLRAGKPASAVYVILSVLVIAAIQPFVDMLGYYNQNIQLPGSLSLLEQLFKSFAELAKQTMEIFFSDTSVTGLIVNIIIIAGLAAVLEEIFFRGCLQQIILKIVKNVHVAVWITAIIFSAIHLDFYGFVPRVILGAALGYLFVWSNNLWIPILAHFLNNASAIVVEYLSKGGDAVLKDYTPGIDTVWAIGSFVVTFSLLILLYKKRECKSNI